MAWENRESGDVGGVVRLPCGTWLAWAGILSIPIASSCLASRWLVTLLSTKSKLARVRLRKHNRGTSALAGDVSRIECERPLLGKRERMLPPAGI